MDCSMPSFPVHHHLLKLGQTHVHQLVMPSSHLVLCHPILLLPSIFLCIRVSSNESVLRIRWPKYWSFSFSISPSNEYLGLISLKIDWFDLLAVQGTLRNLLQHQSSKALILRHSAFFTVPLTTVHDHWENHSLDYIDLPDREMSLLFSTLSRFVIAFLPGKEGLPLSNSSTTIDL